MQRTLITAIIALIMSVPFRFASAHEGYHYAGVTQTSLISIAQATIQQNIIPEGEWVHALGWVALWDTDHSGQYVEAGVGWSSWWEIPKGKVALWYATPEESLGVMVGNVHLETPVEITITKTTVDEVVEITFVWANPKTKKIRMINVYPGVPGWIDFDGIHPTKVEVYSSTGEHPEVNFTFSETNVDPEADIDAYLKADDPYYFTIDSTVENFEVLGGSD